MNDNLQFKRIPGHLSVRAIVKAKDTRDDENQYERRSLLCLIKLWQKKHPDAVRCLDCGSGKVDVK